MIRAYDTSAGTAADADRDAPAVHRVTQRRRPAEAGGPDRTPPGPFGDVWSEAEHQEPGSLLGMMKDLSAGLAAVGDDVAAAAVRQANAVLAPFGVALQEPPAAATWVEKQLDLMMELVGEALAAVGERAAREDGYAARHRMPSQAAPRDGTG